MRVPYNGTEGYVDNPASKARALDDVRSGRVRTRQQQILALVYASEYDGMTWREVQELMPALHHGQISATLSVLHKAGDLFQITHQRGKSHPYLHKEFRNGWSATDRIDIPARTKANKLVDQVAEARILAESLRKSINNALEATVQGSMFYEVINDTITELIALLEDRNEG